MKQLISLIVLLISIFNIDLSKDIGPGSIVFGNTEKEKQLLLAKISEANFREVWVGQKFPVVKKQEAVHIHVYFKDQTEYQTSNGIANWPSSQGIDQSQYPKPPKTYWTRGDLKDLPTNKFTAICDNHRTLAELTKSLQVARVQQCLTPDYCSTCNEQVEGKTLTAEPVFNVFEGIKAKSLRDICFDENLSEEEQIFNVHCFKMIPILMRSYKAVMQLMSITKNMHGSISLDTLYQQSIDRQRVQFTLLDDNWATFDEQQRKQKDNENFITLLFRILMGDDGQSITRWDALRKEYQAKLAELDMDKSTQMHKYASVLGSEDDGLFECFEQVDTKKMDMLMCTQPADQKNSMTPPDH